MENILTKVWRVKVFVGFTVTGLLNTAFAPCLFSPALHCVFRSIMSALKYTKPNPFLESFQKSSFLIRTRAPHSEKWRHIWFSPLVKLVQRLLWLLDCLNVVGANREACFFQEGMKLNERIPHTLQHPCNGTEGDGVGVQRGAEEGEKERRKVWERKESRQHTEDFCGQNVFVLNPPKTSCPFRKPFSVSTTLTQLRWRCPINLIRSAWIVVRRILTSGMFTMECCSMFNNDVW